MNAKKIETMLNRMAMGKLILIGGFNVLKTRKPDGYICYTLAAKGFVSSPLNLQDAAEWIANAE